MTDPDCDEPDFRSLEDWLEREIGKRFPDDVIELPPGQLRVRIFKLSTDLLSLARKKGYALVLESALKARRVLAGKCAQCGGELAYKGALYCGAGCTARSEAHEPVEFKDMKTKA